jgi:hypothetical protein
MVSTNLYIIPAPFVLAGSCAMNRYIALPAHIHAAPSMRFFLLALLLTPATMASAQTEATEEAVERLLAAPAAAIDPALPAVPFGVWLDEVIPKRSARVVQLTECKPKAGGPPSTCLSVDFDIVSRHRQLRLVFARDSLAYRDGLMSATELEGIFAVESLAALPKLLKRGMRPFPLECPVNTTLKLRESYAGLFEWCEDTGGVRHGPSRAWFSTGIYLLDRGQYVDGEKTGEWIECNRFERCAFNTYTNGIRE